MTEREKHIEMAQRLGLVGMRPHLDGIYIDALAAFAKLVADDARATPALPQVPEGMAIVPVEFIHVLQDAPEINPSNYDHDQVCRLNTAVNEALAMLTVAKEKS